MFRPRRLIWLALFIGIGYTVWRWRQSQAAVPSIPATPVAAPPPPVRESGPASAEPPAAPAAGPRRIVTRVHRGAPPAGPTRLSAVAQPEPPPATPEPSDTPLTPEEVTTSHAEPEPPATHEASDAPLTPEEVTTSHAEPEPPATHEASDAPLTPEEVIDGPEQAPAAPAPTGPVNVNTADRQTLIDLPGIGPAIADRIIAYREQHGPFGSIEALVRVQGIGPVSLNEFRHLLTVE